MKHTLHILSLLNALLLFAAPSMHAAEPAKLNYGRGETNADSNLGPDTFQPGKVWLDDRGKPIEAHLGGILSDEGTYYWYGMNLDGETLKPRTLPGQNYSWMENRGVICYSSKDLYHWKYESVSLLPTRDDLCEPWPERKSFHRQRALHDCRNRRDGGEGCAITNPWHTE